MKAKELREKTDQELTLELSNMVKEYQELRFKKVLGVVDNPLRFRTLKKDIARINTLLHERNLEKLQKEMEDME
jgi:large subunit ribosomal protein L29